MKDIKDRDRMTQLLVSPDKLPGCLSLLTSLYGLAETISNLASVADDIEEKSDPKVEDAVSTGLWGVARTAEELGLSLNEPDVVSVSPDLREPVVLNEEAVKIAEKEFDKYKEMLKYARFALENEHKFSSEELLKCKDLIAGMPTNRSKK